MIPSQVSQRLADAIGATQVSLQVDDLILGRNNRDYDEAVIERWRQADERARREFEAANCIFPSAAIAQQRQTSRSIQEMIEASRREREIQQEVERRIRENTAKPEVKPSLEETPSPLATLDAKDIIEWLHRSGYIVTAPGETPPPAPEQTEQVYKEVVQELAPSLTNLKTTERWLAKAGFTMVPTKGSEPAYVRRPPEPDFPFTRIVHGDTEAPEPASDPIYVKISAEMFWTDEAERILNGISKGISGSLKVSHNVQDPSEIILAEDSKYDASARLVTVYVDLTTGWVIKNPMLRAALELKIIGKYMDALHTFYQETQPDVTLVVYESGVIYKEDAKYRIAEQDVQ